MVFFALSRLYMHSFVRLLHPEIRKVIVGKLVVGKNLAKSIHFAYTPADELRGLAAKVKNNYLLLHRGVGEYQI